MIKNLFIQNYALIENLNIDFKPGFTVITGETGAGKSILLGALGLILGKRADSGVLKNPEKKCIAEAVFDIKNYNLNSFFETNEIDFEQHTTVRREIIPGGKSRAFINDTPVTLNQLQEFTENLIDIHSQHENLKLNDYKFQTNLLDSFAANYSILTKYKELYSNYKSKQKELKILSEKEAREKADFDYLQFRFDELENAKLNSEEKEILEEEHEKMSHAEEIKRNLVAACEKLNNDEIGIIKNLRETINFVSQTQKFLKQTEQLGQRLQSTKIELADITHEIENKLQNIEFDPQKFEYLSARLDLIYSLEKKHNVNSINELLIIKDKLEQKLNEISNFDSIIAKTKTEMAEIKTELSKTAAELSNKRKKAVPELENKITQLISQMGMPYAKFSVEIKPEPDFTENGTDTVTILFSANKNIAPQEISKIASGGEISRLMLAVKSIIAQSVMLPAIIFDEIDTGISGEIADKTANIMRKMSEKMQVIDITHLPQVAAKGDYHYKVYKHETADNTVTQIKILNENERIEEIAAMLSGEKITETSLKNALELLNPN